MHTKIKTLVNEITINYNEKDTSKTTLVHITQL